MCGRFTLRTPSSTLARWFEGLSFPDIKPRYNIAPSQKVLALRADPDAVCETVFLRWGLVPGWAEDLRIGNRMINARSETVATKPAFRHAFQHQRCLILADGYYEWKDTPQGKHPFLIESNDPDAPLICFAGLWEQWRPKENRPPAKSKKKSPPKQLELYSDEDSDEEPNQYPAAEEGLVETCTIITTAANSAMAQLHERMPAILDPSAQRIWLDPNLQHRDQLNSLLRPYSADLLRMYPVSKLVNKPAIDDIACTAPFDMPANDELASPADETP
jgi:putative SOS response-associated peptidase YedK